MADEAKKLEIEAFHTKLGIPVCSLKGARNVIEANRTTNNVVCLVGEAGIGKTQLVQQIAASRTPITPFDWHGQLWEKAVPMKTLYLAHMQAGDIGVPYPTRARRNELLRECDLFMSVADKAQNSLSEKAREHALALAEHILNTGSALDDDAFEFLLEKNLKDLPPEGILFLDEWTRADKATIKAFFTLIEDRSVHGSLIPPGIQIIAAMNPSDRAYSVTSAEQDAAFRRRLTFIAVTVNTSIWLEYAKKHFHPYVVEFIQALPSVLYDSKLRDANKVYPCPATWEKVSKVLCVADKAKVNLTDEGVNLSVSGCVGQATGNQFMTFIADTEAIISPADVLNKYTETSDVREKVRRLVNSARHDILNELSMGVAILLFAEQPQPLTIAPHLALFMSDLQPEMAMAFIKSKLNSAAETATNAEAYLTELSGVMISQKPYVELFEKIGDIIERARGEVEKDTKDPLS